MAVLIASSLRKELSGDPLVDQRPPRDAGFSLREYALSRCLSAEEGRNPRRMAATQFRALVAGVLASRAGVGKTSTLAAR